MNAVLSTVSAAILSVLAAPSEAATPRDEPKAQTYSHCALMTNLSAEILAQGGKSDNDVKSTRSLADMYYRMAVSHSDESFVKAAYQQETAEFNKRVDEDLGKAIQYVKSQINPCLDALQPQKAG
jgi:hypothetical protein